MGQSIGSVGNTHKQGGAGSQKKNQPSTNQGQKMADQSPATGPLQGKGKPDGGADHGSRSVR